MGIIIDIRLRKDSNISLTASVEKLDVFFGLFGTKTTAAIVMFGFGFIAVLLY